MPFRSELRSEQDVTNGRTDGRTASKHVKIAFGLHPLY